MAYVNVAEWKTDQVCEWLKGLDNSVLPYVHSFSNHNVNGQQLLNLRPEDLDHLGVLKLGHQETILEAVEYLRNFHYELDRENLQLLSLRLSCLTHSLFNELSRQTDLQPVSTQTLADVATIITAVKPLVCWLDRPPFSGQLEYNDKKTELLKLSLEMATCAQRDRFAEKPIEEIRTTCGQMAKLADYIVQDIADPMILQPASLDLATLKKRPGDDLGFCILPSFHGAHQIAEIKFGSAAHQCGKMEEGDEIVQVNYQTVVGWERKNVLELFRESPAEVLLTLKRRPRHTKVYGQIYIKPYRLPSNKKTPYASRWHHNLPSPRPELLTIPDFQMPLPKQTPKENSHHHHHQDVPTMIDTVDMMLDTITTDSSNDSDSEIESPSSVRLYLAKPRNTVQRRATITGASPTTKHSIDIERFWRELKQEHNSTFQLRDKAASCAHGLNQVPSTRPQTCLGIEQQQQQQQQQQQRNLKTRNSSLLNDEEKIPHDRETMIQDCDTKVPLEKKSSRGELEKCHSTPAYDFLIENKKNLQFPDSSEVKIVIGSVVQKINNIEKHLIRSNEKIYCEKSERGEKREKNLSIEEKYSPPKVPAKKSPRGFLSEGGTRAISDEGGKIIEGEEREKREKREKNEERRERSEEKENRERKERRKRREGDRLEKLEKYEENWERSEEKRMREEKCRRNEEKRGTDEKVTKHEEKRLKEENWERNEEKWAKNEEERVKEENWGKNEEKWAKNEEKWSKNEEERVKEEKWGKSGEKEEKREEKIEKFEEKQVKRTGKMEKGEERRVSEGKMEKNEERRVKEENWGRNEEWRAKDEEIDRNEENWRKKRGKMEKNDEKQEKRRQEWTNNDEERVNEEKMSKSAEKIAKSEEKRVKEEIVGKSYEKVVKNYEKVAKIEEKRVKEEKVGMNQERSVEQEICRRNEERKVKEEKMMKNEERRGKQDKFSKIESNLERNSEKRAKEENFFRNELNFERSEQNSERSEERRAKSEEKFSRNEENLERSREIRAREKKISSTEEKGGKEEKFPPNEERRAMEEKFPPNEERRVMEENFSRNEPNFSRSEERRAMEENFSRIEPNFDRSEERRAKNEERRAMEENSSRNEPIFEKSDERRAKSEEKFSKNEANLLRNEETSEKNREIREKGEKTEGEREKTKIDVERDRKRPEVKPRLCPPEPPPRKYFSKPKVPERPRKEFQVEEAKFSDFANKSLDFEEKSLKSLNSTISSTTSVENAKNSTRSERSLKNPVTPANSIGNSIAISPSPGDNSEQNSINLSEKSIAFDFIDESPGNFDFKNSTLDAYGYSQIYDSQEKMISSGSDFYGEKLPARFNDSRISTLDSRTSNESACRTFDSRISDEFASRTSDESASASRTLDSRLSNESSSRNYDLRLLNESRTLERISNESRFESRTLDSRLSNESRLSNDSRFDSRALGESRTLDSRIPNDSRFVSEAARNFPRDSRTLDARFCESRYEGRNDSWNEGRTDSRNEGRAESRNEGRAQNLRTIESPLRMENALLDSTDGAGCSRQQEKPRTLEKDRGVVNRAMMVARSIGFNTSKTLTSPKTSRKRNMALAKRRNISAKELTPNDLEGWLIYRSRGAGGAWAKAWFVLKGSSLFRFKTQESPKADCLIALAGFTASQATEVKSRKHAFKVYHTGTVFYFAADTDDSLLTWLDAVSKTTVGADVADRSSGLFSETDESDGESSRNSKLPNAESGKVFGSLKKSGKKEQNLPTGASLDRKYLKFLGKSQNVPVPTAQFRSYRRVLPSSTPRKQDSISNSPELPVTVAGSTFYGLNASRSANDVPSSSQDMGDYRRTSDRFPRTRRNDELQGFITLEEFMLSRQDDDHHLHHQQQQQQLLHQQQQQQQQNRGTPSPRFTPLTSDHVHVQHRTFDNLESARMRFARDIPNNNGVIYGFPKNYDETSSTSGSSSYGMQTPSHTFERRASEKTRDSESKNSTPRTLNCMRKKKSPEDPYYDSRLEQQQQQQQQQLLLLQQQQQQQQNRTGAHGQINPANYGCEFIGNEFRVERNNSMDFCSRRIAKNDVYSGSSGDLASHSTDTFKVQKPTVSRNGSFNLADCRRDKNHQHHHHHQHQEKKLNKFEKNKLKHVGQYQPPPILNTPFEQEGMRAAFEMHLDKSEDVQKKNKLKNFFSNKSPQKPSALEIPKETQKTLLGSPRLHRALFRDKSSTQPKTKRSGSQSPGDSGISQSLSSGSASQSQTLSQSYSSVSSVSDWSPDTPASHGPKCPTGHPGCQKRSTNSRNFTSPPTLPYIPPPTSPPPDYPGLEYPPVFEPGTYSLSDASSILRSRNNKNS